MASLGSWKVGDVVTFGVETFSPQTGQAQVADTTPTYRVYKNTQTPPLVTGNFALLDSANVTGAYTAQITLASAAGFQATQTYNVYKLSVTGGITRVEKDTFQIEAAVSAQTVIDKLSYGLSATERSTLIAALLDLPDGIETGLTPRQAFRLMSAMLFGKASGLDTPSPIYFSSNLIGGASQGSTARVSFANADLNGNRPQVTVNLS